MSVFLKPPDTPATELTIDDYKEMIFFAVDEARQRNEYKAVDALAKLLKVSGEKMGAKF